MANHSSGNVKHDLQAILRVILVPKYALIAIISTISVLAVLVWLFSFDTLLYVISLPSYPERDKFNFFISPFVDTAKYVYRDPVVASRQVFSILAGINLAMFLYIRKSTGRISAKKSLGGFGVALVGSGCVACGTSILTPVLIGVGTGTSAIIGVAVGTLGYVIGITLLIYSIHGFSKYIV